MAAKRTFLVLLLASFAVGTVVYSQVPDSLYFGTTSPQVRVRNDLGSGVWSQQYTVYGWYRFSGQTESISNILTMANEVTQGSGIASGSSFYPECPYTQAQLDGSPSLRSSPEIANNPKCASSVVTQTLSSGPPLLYINYDLSTNDFSLLFLIQVGVAADGSSQMIIQGFPQQPLRPNVWTFFAISADYSSGNIFLYAKMFDGTTPVLSLGFQVSFAAFMLRQNFEVILASVQTNPYFESVSGFIGNIAAIEVALLYTQSVDILWFGYLSAASQAFSGLMMDLYFDAYSSNDQLSSKGQVSTNLAISGSYTPLFEGDRNLVGVRFSPSAGIPLSGLTFGNSNQIIRSFSFFFNFLFAEPLPDPFVLITRGTPQADGFFQFSLKLQNGVRHFQMAVQGSSSALSYTSSYGLPAGQRIKVVAGLVFSPGNSAHSVYWDSLGQSEAATLSEAFPFGTAELPFTFLSGSGGQATGSATFFRLSALQSPSGAVLNHLIGPGASFSPTCSLATSFYATDQGCLLCRGSIAMQQINRCLSHCSFGFKNAFSDVCVACKNQNCSEIDSTRFTLQRISDSHFLLTPTRPLATYALTNSLFSVSVGDLSPDQFSHSITPSATNNSLHLKLNYTGNVMNAPLTVRLNQDPSNPVFDSNQNLLYVDQSTDWVLNVCVLSDSFVTRMRVLAYLLIGLLFFALLWVLALSALCHKRIADIGFLYKAWLHVWMKGQLIAFFGLLGIVIPCCVRAFLNTLYRVLVSWDHGIGYAIDSLRSSENLYNTERFGRVLPPSMSENRVAPFFFNNFAIAFIVHCVAFLIYLTLKVWDRFTHSKPSWLYRLFVLWEFSVQIALFSLVATQVFAFAGINFTQPAFNSALFVISLLLAIAYISVFALFIFYSFLKLLVRSATQLAPATYNRFYLFACGYRFGGFAHLYDPLVLLVYAWTGLSIGLLYSSPLAQTVMILVGLVLWLAILCVLRPMKSVTVLIGEFFSVVFLIVASALFLVIAVYNKNGCVGCSDLDFEGSLCYAIVAMLFLALVLPILALLVHSTLEVYRGKPTRSLVEIEQQNYFLNESRAQESRNYLLRQNGQNWNFQGENQGHMATNFSPMGKGDFSQFALEQPLNIAPYSIPHSEILVAEGGQSSLQIHEVSGNDLRLNGNFPTPVGQDFGWGGRSGVQNRDFSSQNLAQSMGGGGPMEGGLHADNSVSIRSGAMAQASRLEADFEDDRVRGGIRKSFQDIPIFTSQAPDTPFGLAPIDLERDRFGRFYKGDFAQNSRFPHENLGLGARQISGVGPGFAGSGTGYIGNIPSPYMADFGRGNAVLPPPMPKVFVGDETVNGDLSVFSQNYVPPRLNNFLVGEKENRDLNVSYEGQSRPMGEDFGSERKSSNFMTTDKKTTLSNLSQQIF